MLGYLGFHYEGDQRFKFPTLVSPALPVKVDIQIKEGFKMIVSWLRDVL